MLRHGFQRERRKAPRVLLLSSNFSYESEADRVEAAILVAQLQLGVPTVASHGLDNVLLAHNKKLVGVVITAPAALLVALPLEDDDVVDVELSGVLHDVWML